MIIFLDNKFLLKTRKRNIDYYVPFSLRLEKESYNNDYIQIKNNNDLLEISIDYNSRELIDCTLVSIDKIFINEKNLDLSKFVKLNKSLVLFTINKFENKELIYFNKKINLIIFKNGLIISIDELSKATFLFYEDNFGIIADYNFNIIGFISWNITSYEFNELIEYRAIKKNIHIDILNNRIPINMIEKNKIIDQILNLKNIDHWKLLIHGLNYKLVDITFIIEFAMICLDRKLYLEKDFLIELASLTKKDNEKVLSLLKHIESTISIDNVNTLIKFGFI